MTALKNFKNTVLFQAAFLIIIVTKDCQGFKSKIIYKCDLPEGTGSQLGR